MAFRYTHRLVPCLAMIREVFLAEDGNKKSRARNHRVRDLRAINPKVDVSINCPNTHTHTHTHLDQGTLVKRRQKCKSHRERRTPRTQGVLNTTEMLYV